MKDQKLRNSLYASFKNRAMMYYHIFKVLREEVGEIKATEMMKKGIHNRGVEIGRGFAQYAPADMEGIKNAFLTLDPDEGNMFRMEVLRCDSGGVDFKLGRCPLREAWQEAGLNDEEVMRVCGIAAAVDQGTFDGAGFEFFAENWKPEFGNFCYMHIRPGKGEKKG